MADTGSPLQPQAQATATAVQRAVPAPPAAARHPPHVTSPSFCSYCQERPAAVWCPECNMRLCTPGGCDLELHAIKGRAQHVRHALPQAAAATAAAAPRPLTQSLPLCHTCESYVATVHCDACASKQCAECDVDVHTHKGKEKHARTALVHSAITSSSTTSSSELEAPAPATVPFPVLSVPTSSATTSSFSSSAAVVPAAPSPRPMCSRCDSFVASVHCAECRAIQCAECEEEVHEQKENAKHRRTKLPAQTGTTTESQPTATASAAAPDTSSSSRTASFASSPPSAPPASLYTGAAEDDSVEMGDDEAVTFVSSPRSAPQQETEKEAEPAAAAAAETASTVVATDDSSSTVHDAGANSSSNSICSSCESYVADVRCDTCAEGERLLCVECDTEVHTAKMKQGHTRHALARRTPTVAPSTEAPTPMRIPSPPRTPLLSSSDDAAPSAVVAAAPIASVPGTPLVGSSSAAYLPVGSEVASSVPMSSASAAALLAAHQPLEAEAVPANVSSIPLPASSSATSSDSTSAVAAEVIHAKEEAEGPKSAAAASELTPSQSSRSVQPVPIAEPAPAGAQPASSNVPDARSSAPLQGSSTHPSRPSSARATIPPAEASAELQLDAATVDNSAQRNARPPALQSDEESEVVGRVGARVCFRQVGGRDDTDSAAAPVYDPSSQPDSPHHSSDASVPTPSKPAAPPRPGSSGAALSSDRTPRRTTASTPKRATMGSVATAVLTSSLRKPPVPTTAALAAAAAAAAAITSPSRSARSHTAGSSGRRQTVGVSGLSGFSSPTSSQSYSHRSGSSMGHAEGLSAGQEYMARRKSYGAGTGMASVVVAAQQQQQHDREGTSTPVQDGGTGVQTPRPNLGFSGLALDQLGPRSPIPASTALPSAASSAAAPLPDKLDSRGPNYNYVLFSLRQRVVKLEELLDESLARQSRAESENRGLTDAYAREQRLHREVAAELARERTEREAAHASFRRSELERLGTKERLESLQKQMDLLLAEREDEKVQTAQRVAALEAQVALHSSTVSTRSDESVSLRTELSASHSLVAELQQSLRGEKELNAKYRSYSLQYESLIQSLREKLALAERKSIGNAQWKIKAAHYCEEWEGERRKMKRKIVRLTEQLDELRSHLRDYRALLKYVAVRGFVGNFLLRKSLKSLFTQVVQLSTQALVESSNAGGTPSIHSSVQMDNDEELEVRNAKLMAEYPWGNARAAKRGKGVERMATVSSGENEGTAAAGAVPSSSLPSSSTGSILGSSGSGGNPSPSAPAPLPPLTACVHSIASQLHVLHESHALIRAQKAHWQSTADSFFKRNIELTNTLLLNDQRHAMVEKKMKALKVHTRALQQTLTEKEQAVSQAVAQRDKYASDLQSSFASSSAASRAGSDRSDRAMLASGSSHAQGPDRSAELKRKVQQLQAEVKALTTQKQRVMGEIGAAKQWTTQLQLQQEGTPGATPAAAAFTPLSLSQQQLMGWPMRDGQVSYLVSSPMSPSSPLSPMRSDVATPNPRDQFEQKQAQPQQPQQQQATFDASHSTTNAASFAPTSHPFQASLPADAASPARSPPLTPILVARSSGRPVTAPAFGHGAGGVAVAAMPASHTHTNPPSYPTTGMMAHTQPLAQTPGWSTTGVLSPTPMGAASPVPSHTSYAPHHPPSLPHISSPSSSRSIRSAHYRPLLSAYSTPQAPARSLPSGSSSRPSSSVSPTRPRSAASGADGRRSSAGGTANVRAGDPESLNRSIVAAAMLRAARRRQGTSAGGRHAAITRAAQADDENKRSAPALQRASTMTAAVSAFPPAPPPLPSLKDSWAQPQQEQAS